LGVGAFGTGFSDCESRFGEFLAAGGCAVTLPAGEPDAIPDYLMQEGNLIPRVETLYSITGTGDFNTMLRFDAREEGGGKIAVSELITSLLELSSAPAIGFVLVAECGCLVGTNLLKSPALGPVDHTLPAVRDWLSFTTERVSERSLGVLVGIAGREVTEETAAFVRPVRSDSDVRAHVHAAVFNYHPVQRGELPFGGAVSKIIGASSPRGLLHLMADSRPYDGVGETDLIRGACWMAPIHDFARG